MKIGVRGGHTELCSGASGLINELTEDRKVKDFVISKLRALGYTVVDCTPPVNYTSSASKDLAYGTDTCNSNNCELYLSIHFNSADSPAAHGTEVCVYSAFDTAQRVVDSIAALGFTNRGQKLYPGYHDVRATNCKAMIIECCFVGSAKDVELYRKVGPEGIANAIVKGVTGQTVASTPAPSNPTETNSSYNPHLKDWQDGFCKVYYSIPVDGIYGPKTEAAFNKAILKVGSNNCLVGWLQIRIGTTPDNIFGNATKAKLEEFQRKYNLDVDGIAGPQVWKKLIEIFK